MRRFPLVLVATGMMLIGACQRQDTTADPESAPATRPAPKADTPGGTAGGSTTEQASLRLSQGSPSYLVDSSGASLYFLEGNQDGARCDATCEYAWPPVATSSASVETGVEQSLVGQIERKDGQNQLTYGGQPLYRYAGDAGAGRTSGHGVEDRWGKWRLLSPSGEALQHAVNADNPSERSPPSADSTREP
ncbi:COG4315 family predicted lipoprotein [Pseudoxanthomonas sp. LARHCG66]